MLFLILLLIALHICDSFRYITRIPVVKPINTVYRAKTSNLDSNNIEKPTLEQVGKWEKEEIELQRQETEEKIKEIHDSGEEIPQYMLNMLDQFKPEEERPTLEAMLPIIAVIGRPNTGKSTLVNKLTNSYKVRILCLLLLMFCLSYLIATFWINHRMVPSCTMKQELQETAHIAPDRGVNITFKW